MDEIGIAVGFVDASETGAAEDVAWRGNRSAVATPIKENTAKE